MIDTLNRIDSNVDEYRSSFLAMLESSTRQGADDWANKATLLGLAIGAAIELVAGKPLPLPPIYWSKFILEMMKKKSFRAAMVRR